MGQTLKQLSTYPQRRLQLHSQEGGFPISLNPEHLLENSGTLEQTKDVLVGKIILPSPDSRKKPN